MKVIVRNGHFAFYPQARDEVLRFMRIFKLALFDQDDYFTFESLIDLPSWSQIGKPFGGLPATITYEGRNAWDVMKANDFVFSLGLEALVPRTTITTNVQLQTTLDCAIAPSTLVQPGAAVGPGQILTGYQGELDIGFQKLYLSSQELLA